MATHADIGVSQPAASTITMKVATVTLTRNSTAQHQELLTIADPDSTNGLARVIIGAPSTEFGMVTYSRVYQSTAADLAATVTLASTGNTVQSRVTTSSGGAVNGSTNTPQGGSHIGLHVRQVLGNMTAAASTMGSGSTGSTVVSSAATVPYVTAFSVYSTTAGPIPAGFYAGSTLLWPFILWADGGKPQEVLAVNAPGFIFKGQADRPIELRIGSTAAVTYGITYWNE
jgi:hypothetical protein